MAVSVDDLYGDDALVDGLRRRDHRAFGLLVERFSPKIRRWAARFLGDAADLEDVVQDVLLASWAAGARLYPGTVLTPWLITITRNECRKRARSRWRRPSDPVGLLPENDGRPPREDPADALDVRAALGALPEREAAILRLVYSEGRPLEEAARVLAVSTEAAKSLAARARRRFRERFGSWFRVVGAAVVLRGAWRIPARPPRGSGVTAIVLGSALSLAVTGAGGQGPGRDARERPSVARRKAAPRVPLRDGAGGGAWAGVTLVARPVPVAARGPDQPRPQLEGPAPAGKGSHGRAWGRRSGSPRGTGPTRASGRGKRVGPGKHAHAWRKSHAAGPARKGKGSHPARGARRGARGSR